MASVSDAYNQLLKIRQVAWTVGTKQKFGELSSRERCAVNQLPGNISTVAFEGPK